MPRKNILTLIISLAVCGLGVFAFSAQAQAATYYVCNSATTCNAGAGSGWSTGNDSNTTAQAQSKATPWKTIQKCADNVAVGDTCIVGDGTYTASNTCKSDSGANCVVTMNRGGTEGTLGNDAYGFNKYDSSTWITFKAENHLGAIVSGNNNNVRLGFDISGNASYIRIEGFDITQFRSAGFGIYNPSTNISIYNNNIHDNGRRCTDTTGGQGTSLYANSGVQYLTFDRNIIHHNGRYATGENGCQNVYHYWQNHDHGIYLSTVNHIVITNNIFYSNKAGWAVDFDRGTDNAYVINNTFYDANPNRDGYILIWTPDDGDTNNNGKDEDLIGDSIVIQNNIFHNPTGAAVRTSLNVTAWISSIINSNISNNIIYGTSHVVAISSSPIQYLDTSSAFSDWGNNSNNVIAGNKFGKDPLFTNGASYDFTLTSSSPAINAGYATSAPAYDFLGIARPQVAGYDIGAYEYVSTAVQCADGIDNDADGLIDYPNDPGCANIMDNDESNALPTYNLQDFKNLLPNWLKPVATGNLADLNSDGFINTADLGMMMSSWQN